MVAAKAKDFLEGLNGWKKVIAVAFACGVFYAKMDRVEAKLSDVLLDHKVYESIHGTNDGRLDRHETRITILELLEKQENK
ncbi:MAG TPA: hypothetical protein VMX15_00075 [Candidatus Heimdallarchaeota archaeon]|nr:hypothetical protein [Candidatus Heimdallarchaeota archaeon]